MNRLLSRMLVVGLAAVLCFALVTALVLRIGFQSVVDREDRRNGQLLSQELDQRLSQISAGNDSAMLGNRLLSSLEGLPVRTEILAIQDSGGDLVYVSKRDRVQTEKQRLSAMKQLHSAEWVSVQTLDHQKLSYAFRTIRLDTEEANQTLIRAVESIALAAAAVALLVAAAVAFLVSRPVSAQARGLAQALARMQSGSRDVELRIRGPQELREIAFSANQLQSTLRREEELRSQWAADIAHDLRTPLTVLKGQLEGMIDGVLKADRERLEKNYAEVLRLEILVNQLAELTRLESPGFRVELSMVDVRQMLSALIDRFSSAAAARGLGIVMHCSLPGGFKAPLDAALCERALSNLVDNAVKYADPDSEIRLVASVDTGNGVCLGVDNAGLIAEEDRPHVFDRLYRGDRSRASKGSGLGLSIAMAIAQAHGGKLSLSSDSESGRTCFTLAIPG